MVTVAISETDRHAVGASWTRWPNGTLLHVLTAAGAERLSTMGNERRYRAGELMIVEGTPDTDVIVLLSGYAKVIGNTADGHVVLLSIRVGGDVVGELAALDGQPRSATVVAATGVTARVVARRQFQEFLAGWPVAADAIHRSVAAKLRMATRQRIDIGGGSVLTRLARMLHYLTAHHGQQLPGGVQIGVPLSQPDLAALINAAEPSLHRAMTYLRQQGVVRTGYRTLMITDQIRLERLALESAG